MADQALVRRIALALPGVHQDPGRFAFAVDNRGKSKGFVWVWQERVQPKQPRVPNPTVIAARVANETEKAALLSADPDVFFTEPHYNGFPAVLVRLPAISEPMLRQVILEAWRCQAPATAHEPKSKPKLKSKPKSKPKPKPKPRVRRARTR